jgi:hypothetical protein
MQQQLLTKTQMPFYSSPAKHPVNPNKQGMSGYLAQIQTLWNTRRKA